MTNRPIVIVGAGFAGSVLAHLLARRGHSVTVVERRERFPSKFRAEKLEPDQVALMRNNDLLEFRRPLLGRIGPVDLFNGLEWSISEVDQYGISYQDTVNALRSGIPRTVDVIHDTVSEIFPHATRPKVRLAKHGEVEASLVVVASGGNERLLEHLGMRRRYVHALSSVTFGFDLTTPTGEQPGFNALTYFAQPGSGVDYLTLFPIGDRKRANLFTSFKLRDPEIGAFRQDPRQGLRDWFPALEDYTGSVSIVNTVQTVPTIYFRLHHPARDGVILIGDDYQSVHPGTGRGLSKVLNDAITLAARHADSLVEQGANRTRVKRYYCDPQKRESDDTAQGKWWFYSDLFNGQPNLAGKVIRRLKNAGMLPLSAAALS